jgi:hypothetical protein
MANLASEYKSFTKENIEEGLRAKEFNDAGGMDDAEAFLETADLDFLEKNKSALRALANWRPANSIKKLRDNVNAKFPHRDKSSDGIIGDTAHCPGESDHCPNINDHGVGVVTAIDITHDPTSGCDMRIVTASIVDSQDRRIKYIIFNRKICSSYPHDGTPAWTWRPYPGSNPHNKHAHFSVLADKPKYDDTSEWQI